MTARERDEFTLVTGATGLIGHHVLGELLDQGRRCAALVRGSRDEPLDRLSALLAALGHDATDLVARERLVVLEGDLCGAMPDAPGLTLDSIVHAAGSTRFTEDPSGDPHRTNADGTAALLAWAADRDVRDLHLISTAYVCGRTDTPAIEAVAERAPEFHNAYERSKWTAEHLCLEFAARHGARVTIHRPSIVVGDWVRGRSTTFTAFYLSVRACELLARVVTDANEDGRRSIPLRLRGRPHEGQNIVPVDYVARMIGAIVGDPALHGRVYHLVNPSPPSNDLIKQAIEEHFDIGGGTFIGPDPIEAPNDFERLFADVSEPIVPYMVDPPIFHRENVAAVERARGIACPDYDGAALRRLFRYAEGVRWGRRPPADAPRPAACAAYFESFLPSRMPRSRIARMTALSTTVRFIIEDVPDGEWICRFESGRLAQLHRGRNGIREDFAYRTTESVFWDSVAGRLDPQAIFLEGLAEITGDVEQALKMAMILNAFNREFPCDRETLIDATEEAHDA